MKTTIQVGAALDALVAEKVMGLRVVVEQEESSMFSSRSYWSPGNDCYFEEVCYAIPADITEEAESDYLGDNPDSYLPEYSLGIAAAWQVVEKMQKLEWVRLELETSKEHGRATFRRLSGGEVEQASAATAPLAICLAALAAVGHKVD